MTWKSRASSMGMALTPSLMTAMMMAMMAIGSQRPWSNKASLAPLRWSQWRCKKAQVPIRWPQQQWQSSGLAHFIFCSRMRLKALGWRAQSAATSRGFNTGLNATKALPAGISRVRARNFRSSEKDP